MIRVEKRIVAALELDIEDAKDLLRDLRTLSGGSVIAKELRELLAKEIGHVGSSNVRSDQRVL